MSHKFDAAKHTWSYSTGELGYVERRRGRGMKLLVLALAAGAVAALVYFEFWIR